MKKHLQLGLLSLVIIILVSCSQNDTSEKDKVYEIELNDSQSPTHVVAKEATEPWAELVEKETEGRVKINIHHNSELGGADNVWNDVKGGVYDIGTGNLPYFFDTELFPLTIGALPLAFPDNITAEKVLEEFKDEYMEEVFDDAKWMGIGVTDGYKIFGIEPVNEISDLKNKKVRTSGNTYTQLTEEWGVVPVSFSFDELYTALQRGTVDYTFFNAVGAAPRKLNEVSPYLLDLDVAFIPYVVIINRGKYEELPKDLQDTMDDLFPKLAEMQNEVYSEQAVKEVEHFEELVGDKGGITELDENDSHLMDAANKVWKNWIEEANDKGYPGDEMAKTLIELSEEE